MLTLTRPVWARAWSTARPMSAAWFTVRAKGFPPFAVCAQGPDDGYVDNGFGINVLSCCPIEAHEASWVPGQSQTPATGVQVAASHRRVPSQSGPVGLDEGQPGTSTGVHQRRLPLQALAMGSKGGTSAGRTTAGGMIFDLP